MSRYLQRLSGLKQGQMGIVMAHPWQLRTVEIVAWLIDRLRGCREWKDYYDFQRHLVGGLRETEDRFRTASRNAKRVRQGRAPSGAAETGDWELDRLVYSRVCRQLRSVGDAFAWRLFRYDRQVIISMSGNAAPGTMFDKEGLGREIGEVKGTWENEKVFSLLNGVTNCIRIGDVTKFYDGRTEMVEVKKNPDRMRRGQAERIKRIVATLNEGAPLVIGSRPVELFRTTQQFKTYPPELRRGLEAARRDGYATIRLGTGWVVTISNLNPEGVTTEEEALALLEHERMAKDRAFEKADMPKSEHHLRSTRLDRIDMNPSAAPYAIYPFDAMTCALLTCDFLSYESVMSWERLSTGFEAHGFSTRCELPEVSGEMDQNTAVILAQKNGYSVVLRAGGIEQVLLELVDPSALGASVDEILARDQDVPAGMFTFANEQGTWR